jgi:MoxR-like ATPase
MNRKEALVVASRLYDSLLAQGIDKEGIKAISARLNGIGKGQRKPVAGGQAISETPATVATDAATKPVNTISAYMGTDNFIITEKVPKYITRTIGGMNDVAILTEACKNKHNTLIVGETGTGKTHAVKWVAKTLGLPYLRVNLDSMVTVEDLVGEFKPNGNGGFVWQDGVLTRFVRTGGIFVCDEINAAPPEVLFLLHGLLDDGRQIVLRQKDGEVLKAHENFWFVATMNFDYEGTKPLNQALLDRFQVNLTYEYSDKVEKKLVTDPYLIEFAKAIRKMHAKNMIASPCSTRQLIQFEANSKLYGARVAKEILVNRFEQQDRKAIKEALEMHIQRTPDEKEDEANDDA